MRTTAAPVQTAAPQRPRRPELIWVGSGRWVVCDPHRSQNDPSRVLGFLERQDSTAYLLHVTEGTKVLEFATLQAAADAVDAILVGGARPGRRAHFL